MTCGGCVATVERTLRELDGVRQARVNLATGQAGVEYEPQRVSASQITAALGRAGYEAAPAAGAEVSGHRPVWLWPVIAGLAATIGLLVFYLALVTAISQSWAHALSLLNDDRWFVAPITLGFGVQMGLFTYLRTGLHAAHGGRASTAVTASSGGVSTAAMIACCAHHVTDVLPLIGLSAAAVFLAQYKIPFMIVGLASTAFGIGLMLYFIWRARRQPEVTA